MNARPTSVVTSVAPVLVSTEEATSISRVGFQVGSNVHPIIDTPKIDANNRYFRLFLWDLNTSNFVDAVEIR
jgi:hypothetical protein